MSLIKCPHCGKEISNTVESCIHCGKKVVEEVETGKQLKDFNSITPAEQTSLKKEFSTAFPEYAKYDNKEEEIKRVHKISWICTIVGIIMALPLIITKSGGFFLFLGIAGLLLFFVSDIVDIMCPALQRRYKKKYLVSLKKYQQWLKDVKGINYTVTFNAAEMNWKKYFDEINLTVEKN